MTKQETTNELNNDEKAESSPSLLINEEEEFRWKTTQSPSMMQES